jgi:hypothetical protein
LGAALFVVLEALALLVEVYSEVGFQVELEGWLEIEVLELWVERVPHWPWYLWHYL